MRRTSAGPVPSGRIWQTGRWRLATVSIPLISMWQENRMANILRCPRRAIRLSTWQTKHMVSLAWEKLLPDLEEDG